MPLLTITMSYMCDSIRTQGFLILGANDNFLRFRMLYERAGRVVTVKSEVIFVDIIRLVVRKKCGIIA